MYDFFENDIEQESTGDCAVKLFLIENSFQSFSSGGVLKHIFCPPCSKQSKSSN